MRKTQIAFGILSMTLVFLMASVVYSYEPKWHGVDYIEDGKVIKSKETAENFLYLFNKVEGLRDCKLSLQKNVKCDYKVSCNCGKYGCSTCNMPGIKAVLKVQCADGTDFKFDGACADARIPTKCGKYGCSPAVCSNKNVVCTYQTTKSGTGTYKICEPGKACYIAQCNRSYCYRVAK